MISLRNTRSARRLFALASAAIIIAPLCVASAVHAQAVGDFNNDGFADLAIGVPGQDVNDGLRAGIVHVIYGTPAGLSAFGAQVWHLDSPGIPSAAETNDRFGRALAVGDFDGDNYDDLAIGIPGREVGSDFGAGAVLILYGGPTGLSDADASIWTQDSPGVLDSAKINDAFGNTLAAGDFNGDGRDDLAIGIPGEDDDDGLDAGAVAILYGSISGITSAGNQFIKQDDDGIDGVCEGGDEFGSALAAGDFNNDGRDDLAIGVGDEDFNGREESGVVHVLFGTVGGITRAAAQTWHLNVPGVPNSADDDDKFGAALAAGDFDDDGFADLAIGIPKKDVGGASEAGAVLVLRGSITGPTVNGVKFFTQDQGSIRDQSENNDRFGNALAVGDFNNDGFDDLAVGVPNETIAGKAGCGAVNIIRGSAQGLNGSGNQFWHQNSEGILDKCEAGDAFGATLATGDFNGDGRDDLAIGIPFENIGNVRDAGAVAVLYGGGQALSKGPDQFWHQNVSGIASDAREDEFFGAANSD